MYKNKMAVGVVKDDLMARVVQDKIEAESQPDYVREMDFTGRPMKGFVFVESEGYQSEAQLSHWIELGIEHAEMKSQEKKK